MLEASGKVGQPFVLTYVRSPVLELVLGDGLEAVGGPRDVVGVRSIGYGVAGEARRAGDA